MRSFHDRPGYIATLAGSVRGLLGRPMAGLTGWCSASTACRRARSNWATRISAKCQKTARLLAEKLKLGAEQYVVSFQSRFGRAKWLQPYTSGDAGATRPQRHGQG